MSQDIDQLWWATSPNTDDNIMKKPILIKRDFCPWCSSEDLEICWEPVEKMETSDTNRFWFAECKRCLARGPSFQKERDAMDSIVSEWKLAEQRREFNRQRREAIKTIEDNVNETHRKVRSGELDHTEAIKILQDARKRLTALRNKQ